MKGSAREPYAPRFLPPIVLLAFLDDPLPLSLKLIKFEKGVPIID
jgi:hypothetical protein